jgi:hypothetical protein
VKVYEISFFGTAKSSTKLIKRIPNVSDINDVYLYNPLSFDPRPYKEENIANELMFDILAHQLLKLKDSTSMIDENGRNISVYHNGEKIVSKTSS